MKFSTLCLLGVVATFPFGLAYVFFPEEASAMYGISGWNASTVVFARLFGAELLCLSAVFLAARAIHDKDVQRWFSIGLAVANCVPIVVLVLALSGGKAGVLTWSAVATYVFFVGAWAWLAMRR